jgi:hypothetical protein
MKNPHHHTSGIYGLEMIAIYQLFKIQPLVS